MDFARGQRWLEGRIERQRQADAVAPRLGPRNLFRDDTQGVFAVLSYQQCRRVIVVGQRAEPVEDLVEEILRVDLLHDLPVDAVADLEHPLAIHGPHRVGQTGRDARKEPSIVAVERRLLPHERHRAPGGAATPDGSDHQVGSRRRMCVPDEPADVLQDPSWPSRGTASSRRASVSPGSITATQPWPA